MKQTGHYGASLLLYAPVALVLLARGNDGLALVGGALAISLAMAPDCDCVIPLVEHRGFTHTVAFALTVGVLVGWAGWVVGSRVDVAAATVFARFTFGVATLTVVSHLLADALTPMGVTPFWPLSERHVTLDLFPAKSWVPNQMLLVLGGSAVVLAVLATNGG